MDLRLLAMNVYFTLDRAPELEPHPVYIQGAFFRVSLIPLHAIEYLYYSSQTYIRLMFVGFQFHGK